MDILDYHQRSKHRRDRYAPGPGYLDWASQPDPFRTYAGSERLLLPLSADRLTAAYADLRGGTLPPPAPMTLETIGALFELSLGLSAWKQYGGSRWALRCNPSSGNLHPTEGYLIAPALPGLPAGLWHYASRDHALERRAVPAGATGTRLSGCFVGLSSIHWREAWKYGMRAFRYCQHDCGHAIAAVGYAAGALGWQARLVSRPSDAELASLLGLDREADFEDAEREVPDCLLWVAPGTSAAPLGEIAALLHGARWQGRANRLSDSHRIWPDIDHAEHASRKPATPVDGALAPCVLPPLAPPRLHLPAAALIRRRRSAVAFDAATAMPRDVFFGMLDALLPRAAPPWSAWDEPPAVHLALFVHRVDGLDPGLYLLLRDAAAEPVLRAALRPDWLWRRLGPAHLPLFLLLPYDLGDAARMISCHQDIAADSCFSLGMLARMDDVAGEPWRYRRRYWECGLVGQALYLEAEAAGLRGTGIGCFFDDDMHELLGIGDTAWQSLYHFTVGGPVEDARLTTLPPYGGRSDIAAHGRRP